MKEDWSSFKIFKGKPPGKRPLVGLYAGGRTILEWMVQY
jgi:hypothetical protein